MNPQDFCCTYEQAVRLKELGIVQGESFFYFNPPFTVTSVLPLLLHNNKFRGSHCADAYNVGELGVMLGYSAKCPSSKDEPKHRAELLISALERNITPAYEVNDRLLNYQNQQ